MDINPREHRYIGAYIRIGPTSRSGPRYILRRYDRSRAMWTVESAFDGIHSTIHHDELVKGEEEGILHVVGRIRAES